jgi:hypothetical protein
MLRLAIQQHHATSDRIPPSRSRAAGVLARQGNGQLQDGSAQDEGSGQASARYGAKVIRHMRARSLRAENMPDGYAPKSKKATPEE